MSDPLDASTPSANEVRPDPAEPEDPADLQSAGDLDEDELGTDPLEDGVEPAERWSPVAEGRPTPGEQREGSTLEQRLAEEGSDNWEDVDTKPVGESRVHELDESVDERAAAEVSDGVSEQPPGEGVLPGGGPAGSWDTEHGAVLQGETTEETGLSAQTNEGEAGGPVSTTAPEEAAERVEDGGG